MAIKELSVPWSKITENVVFFLGDASVMTDQASSVLHFLRQYCVSGLKHSMCRLCYKLIFSLSISGHTFMEYRRKVPYPSLHWHHPGQIHHSQLFWRRPRKRLYCHGKWGSQSLHLSYSPWKPHSRIDWTFRSCKLCNLESSLPKSDSLRFRWQHFESVGTNQNSKKKFVKWQCQKRSWQPDDRNRKYSWLAKSPVSLR